MDKNREAFDEDILYDPPEMMIVDQSIEEDEAAEEDLFYGQLEDVALDSIIGDIDDEIDSIYVNCDDEEE